jgi:hypothetical protein
MLQCFNDQLCSFDRISRLFSIVHFKSAPERIHDWLEIFDNLLGRDLGTSSEKARTEVARLDDCDGDSKVLHLVAESLSNGYHGELGCAIEATSYATNPATDVPHVRNDTALWVRMWGSTARVTASCPKTLIWNWALISVSLCDVSKIYNTFGLLDLPRFFGRSFKNDSSVVE